MSEAAVKKLDTLITESQSQANNLFAFDAPYVDVPVKMKLNEANSYVFYHRLRKPTPGEVFERESQVSQETREISSHEHAFRSTEEAANGRLWNKLSLAVKGYGSTKDWVDLSDEDRKQMRPGHKNTAIRALYAGSCEIERNEGGITIGPQIWTLIHKIGLTKGEPDFIVRHILREPIQDERDRFKESASVTSYVTGATKTQTRTRKNLRAYADLYDALIQGVEGATVGDLAWGDNGFDRGRFLVAIDPIWKRLVVETLADALEGQFLD